MGVAHEATSEEVPRRRNSVNLIITTWSSLSADEEPAFQNDLFLACYSIHFPPYSSPFPTGRQLR